MIRGRASVGRTTRERKRRPGENIVTKGALFQEQSEGESVCLLFQNSQILQKPAYQKRTHQQSRDRANGRVRNRQTPRTRTLY
jgi:hypothetical protein